MSIALVTTLEIYEATAEERAPPEAWGLAREPIQSSFDQKSGPYRRVTMCALIGLLIGSYRRLAGSGNKAKVVKGFEQQKVTDKVLS